jgi:F0F1-type ATP synthase assembly protein I
LSMSDELSKEILEELKKLNEKIDQLQTSKGLSTPMKFVAILLGFVVIGPTITILISRLFN